MHPSWNLLWAAVAFVAAVRPAGAASAAEEAPVDFGREIQPVLRERCESCHGSEKQRGGYRLDVKAVALRGGDSGEAAIVPGAAARSHLVRRVSGEVADERMPPKGEPLTVVQVALLRRWIDQGAAWPEAASAPVADPLDWWSLKPIRRPEVPATAGGVAGGNPVDAFLDARLAAAGVRSVPEADRRTLIRRVTFDLLGLPPSPEEVDAFGADPGPRAYERLVDRLLASPHYGERWARYWLDVVHYGDTHGYDKDKPRPNAWPYRDYLIRSFDADKPYARFVQEQIAGDALFPDEADGIEALGFVAAGPWDFIGHEELPESKIDGKIARHLDRDDMVSNTLGTFMSVTVHCAQCHDHKFDPVSQEDYYRLQAVFAAVDRTERRYHREPELNRQRAALEGRERGLEKRRQELEAEIVRAGGEALKRAEAELAAAEKEASGGQPAEYGYHSAIAAGADETKWVQVDLGRTVALERVVLAPCRDSFNNIGDGFGFPVRFRIEAAADASLATDRVMLADRTGADVSSPGVARQEFAAGGRAARYVRVTATRLAPRQNDFILALAELEAWEVGGTNVARGAAVTGLDSIEAPERWQARNLTDGKAPGSAVPPGRLESLRAERLAVLERTVPAALRERRDAVTNELAGARRELKALPEPLKVYAGGVHYGGGNFRGTGPDDGRPRLIRVLARGDVKKPGATVGSGALHAVRGTSVPAVFDLPDGGTDGERRAALARWVTDPGNPLTWRSLVNRAWQLRFGRGLVETPNDFGRMGGRPSHPELLDWLAAEFRDGGQSLKQLDRLLVTSAAYRRAAAPPDPGDPDNRLLGRRTARRLDAEGVRDGILTVSGCLDRTLYGPGFQDFVVEKPEHSPHYQYHLHDPEDPKSWRRSVYRFLVRSQQEPFMVALDCADPSMRVDRRNETLTPLQALALMNSQLTVAMARHVAGRVEEEAGKDPGAQVDRAFRLALQRSPQAEEREVLAGFVRQHGLASACRLLLNLNEFVFVD